MPPQDMPAEEFRRFGYEVIDWIAGYLNDPGKLPVLPGIAPGNLTDLLPVSAPEQGEPMEKILEDFRTLIVPHSTLWNHPRFFSFFSVSTTGPGILAEALIATLNMNGMLWRSSPAVTELEQVTLSWLRQWLGLPESFFGIIHDTASTSTMHAILAARAFADPDTRVRGASADLVLYTSEQAHSSVEKGALALGVGQRNVRKIAVDQEFRMIPAALGEAVSRDRAAGARPFCVVATVGTPSTTSVDPVPEIADICEREQLWLHVDGAYGGHAAIVPEYRHFMDGASRADSLVINPHKWLFTPIDLSVLYLRRPEVLRNAISLSPEYLRSAADPRAVNFMDYGVPLGRRFRALKLWFVMRYFGREKITALIRNHIRMTHALAAEIASDARFELYAPVPMSLICFRLRGSDEANRQLIDCVNGTGHAFFSATVLNGKTVIRWAVGNIHTTREDLDATWSMILKIVAGGGSQSQ
ncbi:MAG TPA: pyridoxal-dependent decarboxylase [Bryobacteraceae bacterium]|nr:pyridoxal-dependent decarboxylase [Bryobacteraceae bacterium]